MEDLGKLLRIEGRGGRVSSDDLLRRMSDKRSPQPAIAIKRVIKNTICPRFTESLR